MMTIEMQLDLQMIKNAAVLHANRMAALPASRVQVVWHPRGWRVAVTRGDCCEVLPAVHAESWDADDEAARLAVREDVTLVLDNDPDGVFADAMIDRVVREDEMWEQVRGWMR
jgi:hypothetical protein